MSNTHTTLTGLFADIADAIREKDGTSTAKVADAFPAAIRAIPSVEDTDAEDAIITKTISGTYENSRVTNVGGYAFYVCTSLTTVSFPACTGIGNYAFYRCYKLLSFYIAASSVCMLSNSNAFSSTPIAGYTTSTSGVYGSIFVPASLVDAYKSATNWTYFADRITAIPESE